MKRLKNFVINLALLVSSVIVTLFIFELFLRTFMPVAIGMLNSDNYQLSENSILVYEPKPLVDDINADSLRDYDYPINKGKDTFRIAVIGDSLAFGYGVNLQDAYAKQLELKLNAMNTGKRYEVLNFGVGGYDIQQSVERLKEKARGCLKTVPEERFYQYRPPGYAQRA